MPENERAADPPESLRHDKATESQRASAQYPSDVLRLRFRVSPHGRSAARIALSSFVASSNNVDSGGMSLSHSTSVGLGPKWRSAYSYRSHEGAAIGAA